MEHLVFSGRKAVPNPAAAAYRIRRARIFFALFLCGIFSLRVSAAPAIDAISPAQGEPGVQVLLAGRDLAGVTQVLFNTTLADFSVISNERMWAIVPVGSLSGPVFVSGPSGVGRTAGNFLVAPRIGDFRPRRAATNSIVNIFGENLEAVTNILFGPKPAKFTILGSGQLTAIVPFGATNGPVTVRGIGGSAITIEEFIVTGPGPLIDNFSPAVAAPGTTVIIDGANFNRVTSVQFNGVAANFSVTSPSQIHALIPAAAVSGPIRVTTPLGTTVSTNNLTVTRAPVIVDFFPRLGTPGVEVILNGLNFQGVTAVTFNGRPAVGFGTPGEGQINAIVPADATTGPVRVSNAFGTGATPEPFVITRAPIITNFAPVIAAAGMVVTVSGANFTGATLVQFTGANAVPSVVSDSQLHVTVPAAAQTGPFKVVTPRGTGTNEFPITIPGNRPYVTEIAPDFGPRGTEVIVSGANFLNVTAVRFNGANAIFDVTAPTQIRAFVPSTATSGPLTVTSATGTSTNETLFFVPPRLTAFLGSAGAAGDVIEVRGANFLGTLQLAIGGVPAAFTIASSNVLHATINSETRSGPIAIGTPGGVFISSNLFTVLPRVVSFTPTLGPAGTQVAISGTSFFDVQSVAFNNVPAAFTAVSTGQIIATVPDRATPGLIQITTRDGTGASSTPFLVTAPSDLAVTQTASSPVIQPGELVNFLIVVTNRGPATVTDATLTNIFPAGHVLVGASSSRGSCFLTNGLLLCPLGIFTNNTSVEATVQIRAATEGLLTNRVFVGAVETDPNLSNNRAETTVIAASDTAPVLRIERLPSADSVVLSWLGPPVLFQLQAATNLVPPIVWSNVAGTPVVVGNQNRVTNTTAELRRFYRVIRTR